MKYITLLFTLLFMGCNMPNTVGIYQVEIQTVKFADRDTGPLEMDISMPVSSITTNRPAVIWFHGGAFVVESKQQMRDMITFTSSLGYVSIAPDYRLATQGGVKLRDIYQDARDAYLFIRTNASNLGIDINRISLGGDSAGAHLALLVGLKEEGVKSIIDLYGSTDLMSLYNQSNQSWKETIVSLVMGSKPDDDPESWSYLSPINFVSQDSPPILIMHGTKDILVPFSQATALRDKINQVGGRYIFTPVENADHGWVLDTWGNTSLRTLPVITQFLSTY
jgi:acetyl esterase/lipase